MVNWFSSTTLTLVRLVASKPLPVIKRVPKPLVVEAKFIVVIFGLLTSDVYVNLQLLFGQFESAISLFVTITSWVKPDQ